MKRLIQIRKDQVALRRGDLTFLMTSSEASNGPSLESNVGILAFARAYGDSRVVVVQNTHSTRASETISNGTGLQSGFEPGTRLQDQLSDTVVTVGNDGSLVLSLEPNQTMILTVKQSESAFCNLALLSRNRVSAERRWVEPIDKSCRYTGIFSAQHPIETVELVTLGADFRSSRRTLSRERGKTEWSFELDLSEERFYLISVDGSHQRDVRNPLSATINGRE